ncbi:hypothetical protein [Microbacterium capsulatum]|uniref:Uncharacterized protein n=1 Tax=Microbacterium capsulatum TaxID=3041921 RepID=A0ABU0XBI4_9MICO|nr:hypothetical protein [Microbacterium sp. ASV81]MDQ4212471.1 hypothetical protein [Microbacterium sp. ASV81]
MIGIPEEIAEADRILSQALGVPAAPGRNEQESEQDRDARVLAEAMGIQAEEAKP